MQRIGSISFKRGAVLRSALTILKTNRANTQFRRLRGVHILSVELKKIKEQKQHTALLHNLLVLNLQKSAQHVSNAEASHHQRLYQLHITSQHATRYNMYYFQIAVMKNQVKSLNVRNLLTFACS